MQIQNRKIWLARSVLVLVAAVFTGVSVPVLARSAYPRPSQARNLAVSVCGVCHGVDGNSKNPMFPRLAGQKAWYIEQQLKEFRAHTRGDAAAVGYMWGMAHELSNATIVALAKYFSHQKPGPGKSRPAAVLAEGNRIYHHGIPSQGVPACAACHGAHALGNANFPRVAGQHAEYALKQLNAFRTEMRYVLIMHGICSTLHAKQDKAVADYLASLP